MPIGENNQDSFYARLYAGAGMLQNVTLLKRGDDQKQGTVRAVKLFECRWGRLTKTGQTIRGEESSDFRRDLHIPRYQLRAAGVQYVNALDRFVDREGRYWQPESDTEIVVQLIETHVCVNCKSVNPPQAG